MTLLDQEIETGAQYVAPKSVEEVVKLLTLHEAAKVVAGGQSLFVFLRQGLLQPDLLIGLRQIPELRRIDLAADGGLNIGAMVTQYALLHSPLIAAHAPMLAEAAAQIASPPIRRQGTIGGNLCHADPTSDPPPALIALGAKLEIVSENGSRWVPVEDFFVDYMETILQPTELLTTIRLPAQPAHSGAAYLKHRIRGVDTALVSAAVAVTLAEDLQTIVAVRIGMSGVSVAPLRAHHAEAALLGVEATEATISAAAAAAAEECNPLTDTEGSEWYRREMVAVFVRRATEQALARARGDA